MNPELEKIKEELRVEWGINLGPWLDQAYEAGRKAEREIILNQIKDAKLVLYGEPDKKSEAVSDILEIVKDQLLSQLTPPAKIAGE